MLPMLIVFTFSLKLSFLLSLFVSSSAFVSEGFFFPIKANERPGLSKLEATKIGFVGFGTIANAIATGLATQDDIQLESISVTKRSEQKSKAFAEKFPSLVSVQDDSQKILDQADVIFVCVLPEQASQVLQDLSFDNSRHTLVSLVVSELVKLLFQQ